MDAKKLSALQFIDEKKDVLRKVSDSVWENAETAFQEYKSVGFLCDALRAEGFKVETNVGNIETAFTGTFGSGKPVIGFLGEFDALSGLDQVCNIAEKKAENPGAPGHGCGHNMLGVGALGAAMATKKYLEDTKMPGTVIFFGCPGEEGGSGKAFMAREGVFNNLDFALSWHPADVNCVTVGSSNGNVQVKYRYKGISAHAAACPHLGRSALDAVELLNVGVQFLREHMIPEARIHYAITNTGGYSPNVVQPEAEVLYLIRAPKNDQVQELYARVNKIAYAAAEMTETTLEPTFIKACSNMIPNNVLEEVLYKNLNEIPLPEMTPEKKAFGKAIVDSIENRADTLATRAAKVNKEHAAEIRKHFGADLCDFVLPYEPSEVAMPGSTDVSDVSWCCPTAQVNTATWALGTPGHSWQVVAQGKSPLAYDATRYASKAMAGAAIDALMDPSIIERARAEFKDRVGEGYKCPIPKGIKPTILKAGM